MPGARDAYERVERISAVVEADALDFSHPPAIESGAALSSSAGGRP